MSSTPTDNSKQYSIDNNELHKIVDKTVRKIIDENPWIVVKKRKTDDSNKKRDKNHANAQKKVIKPTKSSKNKPKMDKKPSATGKSLESRLNNRESNRNNHEIPSTSNYNHKVNKKPSTKHDKSDANLPKKHKKSTTASTSKNDGEPRAKRSSINYMNPKISKVPCKKCNGKEYQVNKIINHEVRAHGKVYYSRLWSNSVKEKLSSAKKGSFAFANKQEGLKRYCCFRKELRKSTYERWFYRFTKFTGEYIWKCDIHGLKRTIDAFRCKCEKRQLYEIPKDGIYGYICNDDKCKYLGNYQGHYIQLFFQNFKSHMKEEHNRDISSYEPVLLMPKFEQQRQRRKSVVNRPIASTPTNNGNWNFTFIFIIFLL